MNKWYDKENRPETTHKIIEKVYEVDTARWPQKVRKFLGKYHFNRYLCEKYNLQWAEDCRAWSNKQNREISVGERLIYPVYDIDDTLVVMECRSLDRTDQFKYISQGNKQDNIFRSKPGKYNDGSVVIVEDILSAIRIGESYPTVAVLGCKPGKGKLKQIAECGTEYIIWLDGDEPGQKGAKKLKSYLSQFGPVVNIVTDEDPKCYTDEEIRKIVIGNIIEGS
jgi:DNA primase